MFKTQLAYNLPLLRQAVLRFWLRTVGPFLLMALLLIALCLGEFSVNGYSSWIIGILVVFLAINIIFAAAVYVAHYRSALQILDATRHSTVTFVADEATFSIIFAAGSTTTLPWSAIKKIVRYNESWLLMFSKGQFITFPLAGTHNDIQQYILSQVKKAGGKIK